MQKAPPSRECFLKNRSKLQMTIMVAEAGFEPTASRLWASRAARLLYSAVCPFRGMFLALPWGNNRKTGAAPSGAVEEDTGLTPVRHFNKRQAKRLASASASLPYSRPAAAERVKEKRGIERVIRLAQSFLYAFMISQVICDIL